MTNDANGYHLHTTEELVSSEEWARELADIAPLLDDTGDRDAFDRLRTIRASIARALSSMPEAITGLDLADIVLTANEDQRLQAMDRLLFWAEERRPLDIHAEWAYTPPDLEWIIGGWLPAGRIGILSGQGGRGKSRLALQLAAALAAGQSDFLGGPSTAHGSIRPGFTLREPQTVVYASWEDDRDEVARRLRALATSHQHCRESHRQGAPFHLELMDMEDRLRYVDMAGEGPIWGPPPGSHVSTMGDITPAGTRIRKFAEESSAKLLVLDPLAASFGSNENDRALVRAFLAHWDRWGRDNDCAILILAHPPKTTSVSYSGSTDWEAGSRFMWTLDYKERVKGEDAKPALTLEKSNYGRRGARIWLEICNKGVWAEAETEVAVGDVANGTAGLSKV